ncbi:hypothetical protein [Oceanivirga salmonicida]|uniref:hypothetical protein n=1 Tax=Oceanivirga salmonicida TaxID=1769291 RepID=UPI0008338ED3|nr:hypothetical protein [Oceanivirga salmonicida]
MAIIKFKNISNSQAKILFGIVMPEVLYRLYEVTISEEAFEGALKTALGIHPKRMVKFVEAVQGESENILLLVIFDKIVSGKSFYKDKLELEVKDFNFNIYHYDFNKIINVEYQIDLESRGR